MGHTAEPLARETRSLDALALEQLEAVICQGAANLTCAERDWLLAVAEFDRREACASWGCVSTAPFLSWQVGLDLRAAREKVRVARALLVFPLISEAMGSGSLSYSKVRAITRIALPETESSLVAMALAGTTNHVERIVSAYRRVEQGELGDAVAQHQGRSLQHSFDADGAMVIKIRVPVEAGVVILSAVEKFVTPAKPDADGNIESLSARRADAMVAVAEAATTNEGATSAPYLVTVHVDADTLVDDEAAGRCDVTGAGDSVTNPIGVACATARRLACDGDIEVVVEDGDGNPLYMGRRSRLVRGALRRAVKARDGNCRFPGCDRRGRAEAHHAVHWTAGGETSINNVLLLCRFHHHTVHEGGWHVIADPVDGFRFRTPHGRIVRAAQPVFAGRRSAIDSHNRTAKDGRCRWGGEQLDLDLALTALFCRRDRAAHERMTSMSRTP